MSLVPAVATAAATSGAADIGFWGHALIYIGVAAMFGLIGLVPAMAEKDRQREALRAAKARAKAAAEWTVEDVPVKRAPEPHGHLKHTAQTIDADFAEIPPAPQLSGDDPRWGR